jgi:hypothetical protein
VNVDPNGHIVGWRERHNLIAALFDIITLISTPPKGWMA